MKALLIAAGPILTLGWWHLTMRKAQLFLLGFAVIWASIQAFIGWIIAVALGTAATAVGGFEFGMAAIAAIAFVALKATEPESTPLLTWTVKTVVTTNSSGVEIRVCRGEYQRLCATVNPFEEPEEYDKQLQIAHEQAATLEALGVKAHSQALAKRERW